jgi:hypothetical protein
VVSGESKKQKMVKIARGTSVGHLRVAKKMEKVLEQLQQLM